MKEKNLNILKAKCAPGSLEKLIDLKNPKVEELVARYAQHCNPDSVFVRNDSKEDADCIRKRAIGLGEEKNLATEGHTVHFDGFYDQARDKAKTMYLLPKGESIGSDIKSTERNKGLKEIREFLRNSMQGKQMYVCFFCLGPINSAFSILAVQITDSSYVAHSEHMLMRDGYE